MSPCESQAVKFLDYRTGPFSAIVSKHSFERCIKLCDTGQNSSPVDQAWSYMWALALHKELIELEFIYHDIIIKVEKIGSVERS